MLIGGVEGPYCSELHIGAVGEYALGPETNSRVQAALKERRRSVVGDRVTLSAFRIDRLRGDRVTRHAKWAVPQEGGRHRPTELVARLAVPLKQRRRAASSST